jgi:RimJ/RimL family protein N-acetyltransferase
MFHRSERLLLRPVFAEDWRDVYQGINDEGVVRMLGNAPWPYSEADAREFASRARDPKHLSLAVTLPGDVGTRLIGVIGMGDRGFGMEIGYWIARRHWGRGYATEAGKGLIAIARMLGHRKLLAGHATDNPASGRVLCKLGFRPTGEVRAEHSKGRGEEMLVRRYVNELAGSGSGDQGPPEMSKAA